GLPLGLVLKRLRLPVLLRKIKEAAIICGGLVLFLDGQMRVGDVVLEVKRRGSGKRKRGNSPHGGGQRHCLPHCQRAVLNSSKMSHSRSFDLLLTTPERGPESLWFEAGDCTDLASQCQRGGQQLQHDRAVSLPAEATAVAMPAASLMPPSSTSSRPTSWHEEPPPQQPQRQRHRRGPLIARASDPDVAATIQAAVAAAAAAAGSSPPEVARRGSADDLLDSPSDDNNDTGENGGGVVEILDGVHGGGGPAEDEEDDDATIVEDESTAAPLQQLSRSAMVN
uniref:Ubiquitin-like domain-containing protein n=1 Tax=Macrostomum lignano TaxID=282301 RepID=A0A1I8FL51_9PLAT